MPTTSKDHSYLWDIPARFDRPWARQFVLVCRDSRRIRGREGKCGAAPVAGDYVFEGHVVCNTLDEGH
jgi:hypothetical protein